MFFVTMLTQTMCAPATLLKLPTLLPAASSRHPRLAPCVPFSSFGLRVPGGRVAGLVSQRSSAMRELAKVKTPAFGSREPGDEESVAIFQGGEGGEEAGVSGESHTLGHGFEATLNRLSKWIIAAVICAVVLLKHDAEAIWAVAGSALNSTLSQVLKRILNQERPISTLRSDPGMPSSHAQSIFFVVSFCILSSVEWLGVDVISVMISISALAIGSYLTWLRVSQQLHTVEQVIVGAAVGTIFAILWFWSWKAVLFKAFVSFLWFRIVVVLAAASFCMGFFVYEFCHWRGDINSVQ